MGNDEHDGSSPASASRTAMKSRRRDRKMEETQRAHTDREEVLQNRRDRLSRGEGKRFGEGSAGLLSRRALAEGWGKILGRGEHGCEVGGEKGENKRRRVLTTTKWMAPIQSCKAAAASDRLSAGDEKNQWRVEGRVSRGEIPRERAARVAREVGCCGPWQWEEKEATEAATNRRPGESPWTISNGCASRPGDLAGRTTMA